MVEEIRRLEAGNWWFVGMRRIAETLLAKEGRAFVHTLDLGCGSGGNLALLQKHSQDVVAFDLSAEALSILSVWRGIRRVAGDGVALPFRDGAFDLVNLFNVIEHIEDDERALSEVRRVLAPGGALLVATSAFRALWSDHDEANRHFRRYEAGELRGVLRRAGFEVMRQTFANALFFGPTFAVAAARRTARRMGLLGAYEKNLLDVSAPVNLALTGMLALESRLLERFDLPFGVSIFALARRT
jgi:SAM-dependent methyltransferase